MEQDFEIKQDGTTLNIFLGKELSAANANKLTEVLDSYYGQGIEKVVYDATALSFVSSSGIRNIMFTFKRLGSNPKIVFVNCAKEIYDVLYLVGLANSIEFVESPEMRKRYQRQMYFTLEQEEIDQQTQQQQDILDNYQANNDVVCYSMKIGEDE